MTSHVITPSWARAERRLIRSDFAELHADVRRARALRATGRILDAEDAEAILTMVWARHHGLRRRIKWLRTVEWATGSTNMNRLPTRPLTEEDWQIWARDIVGNLRLPVGLWSLSIRSDRCDADLMLSLSLIGRSRSRLGAWALRYEYDLT